MLALETPTFKGSLCTDDCFLDSRLLHKCIYALLCFDGLSISIQYLQSRSFVIKIIWWWQCKNHYVLVTNACHNELSYDIYENSCGALIILYFIFILRAWLQKTLLKKQLWISTFNYVVIESLFFSVPVDSNRCFKFSYIALRMLFYWLLECHFDNNRRLECLFDGIFLDKGHMVETTIISRCHQDISMASRTFSMAYTTLMPMLFGDSPRTCQYHMRRMPYESTMTMYHSHPMTDWCKLWFRSLDLRSHLLTWINFNPSIDK